MWNISWKKWMWYGPMLCSELTYLHTHLLTYFTYLLTRYTLESYPAAVQAQNPGTRDVTHEVSK